MDMGCAINRPSPPKKKGDFAMFCHKCGAEIDDEAIICPHCGCGTVNYQQKRQEPQQIVINNSSNSSSYSNASIFGHGKMINKWVSFFLCLFLGPLGAHKFYERKIGMGILYLFTLGLFGVGWIVDIIVILFKPNPYYV